MAAVPRKGPVCYEDGDDTDDDTKTLLLKRARVFDEGLLNSTQQTVTVQDVLARTDARALLRRVYFLNEGRSRNVFVGICPSNNYQVLAESGGWRIAPITLTEHHVRTLAKALPILCDSMQRGEL